VNPSNTMYKNEICTNDGPLLPAGGAASAGALTGLFAVNDTGGGHSGIAAANDTGGGHGGLAAAGASSGRRSGGRSTSTGNEGWWHGGQMRVNPRHSAPAASRGASRGEQVGWLGWMASQWNLY